MKLDNNSKSILAICAIAALVVIIFLVSIDRAKAGTAQPLPGSTPEYPVICTNDAGKVTLVADGRKVRVAYWNGDKPYFTDGNRAARHKRTFAAPAGSVCRIGASPEATVVLTSAAARG